MTIRAELADGRVLEFPDGTDPSVIQATVKRMIGASQGQQIQEAPQEDLSVGEQIAGGLENVASLASGIVSEPLAGLRGIGAAIAAPVREALGFDTITPKQIIEETREAATFQPKTIAGQRQQQAIGEVLAPVGEALQSVQTGLGDAALELTGSPAIAAAAFSLPTAALELIGLKGSKIFTKADSIPSKKQINRALIESAPEVETLKNTARQVYDEIDQSGVRVRQQPFDRLVANITQKTRKQGLDADVTPRAAGAINRLQSEIGSAKTLSEIDTLRKVSQNVAQNIDKTESALGNIMISEIDDFLDNLKASDTIGGTVSAAQTGKKFKAARKLWGRARRSELIQDAITRGGDVAAGAESGIRNEFNRILRNKKLSKFIPKDELKLMRDVVQGDFKQNITRMIGKFGLSIDRSPNVFQSILAGGGAGLVFGGTTGALVVPAIGTISKKIAQTLTTNKARFVDTIARAGTDGERIAKAYLSAVPKAKRKISDLADLLSDPNVDIQALDFIANKTVQDALELAKGRRSIDLASAALLGESGQATQQEVAQ